MMTAMYSSLDYLYLQVISQILYLHRMPFFTFGIKENIWASSALLSLCNTGCYSYFSLRLKNVLFQVIYLFLCLCHFLSVSVFGSLSVSISVSFSLSLTHTCVRACTHTHTVISLNYPLLLYPKTVKMLGSHTFHKVIMV